MSFIRKGPANRFPKGLKVEPLGAEKFRVTLSAGFAQVGCDFSAGEVEHMAAHLVDVVQMVKLTGFNYAPTKENINIEDEESRA